MSKAQEDKVKDRRYLDSFRLKPQAIQGTDSPLCITRVNKVNKAVA